MADVIFVGVICAFFALCVVYVRWCDRIIGADHTMSSVTDGPPDAVADKAPQLTLGVSA